MLWFSCLIPSLDGFDCHRPRTTKSIFTQLWELMFLKRLATDWQTTERLIPLVLHMEASEMRLFSQTRPGGSLFIDWAVARELTAIAEIARRRADVPEVWKTQNSSLWRTDHGRAEWQRCWFYKSEPIWQLFARSMLTLLARTMVGKRFHRFDTNQIRESR